MANTVYQRSKLLNKYYEKVGRVAAGEAGAACPKFTEFRAGYGLVDVSDPDSPVLEHIPPNMTTVPNEFYRGLVTATYSNGVTVCKCEIPANAVVEPVKYNLIGIFDQEGDLVAVCTTFPDWVTPTEADRTYPALTFPIEAVSNDDDDENDGEGGDDDDGHDGEVENDSENDGENSGE